MAFWEDMNCGDYSRRAVVLMLGVFEKIFGFGIRILVHILQMRASHVDELAKSGGFWAASQNRFQKLIQNIHFSNMLIICCYSLHNYQCSKQYPFWDS